MERAPGEEEAHSKPELRGRARTTRRQAGLSGNGASAEWAHTGAGNQAQVARRVLKRQRQKTSNKLLFLWDAKKEIRASRPGPKDKRKGAERGPASRRLSRIIGPERTFVLPLLRRVRTLSFFSRDDSRARPSKVSRAGDHRSARHAREGPPEGELRSGQVREGARR